MVGTKFDVIPVMRKANKKLNYQSRASKFEKIVDKSKGRICHICETYKERDQFYRNPNGWNELGSVCKSCIRTTYDGTTKKNLYNKRKNLGICIKCENPKIVNSVHCIDCWFVDKSCIYLGSSSRVQELLDLWNHQNGECFYTKEKLFPGQNASIDHQIPKSQGGVNDIENYKWVSMNINLMKSNMNDEEFMKMCQKVLDIRKIKTG